MPRDCFKSGLVDYMCVSDRVGVGVRVGARVGVFERESESGRVEER